MGKIGECFVCEMLLARLERETVEATPSEGDPELVPVCARCHLKVLTAGAVAMPKIGIGWVLRPRSVQRELFPAASRAEGASRGRGR